MNILFDKISNHYSKELPFVCYRKPNEETTKGVFVNNSNLTYSDDYNEKGFIFAPFEHIDKAIIFPNKDSEIIEESLVFSTDENSAVLSHENISQKEEHIALVNLGIDAILKNHFKKVVLSRKEQVEVSEFYLESVFKNLLISYQNAFVYVWFHPEVGLWFGATPERLVTLEGNEFTTMALASTQVFKGNINPEWGQKEKEEHQYVVDYIVSQILDQSNGIILEDFQVSDAYSVKAGNLLHLKADIKGKIGEFNLKNLLKTLHPTPAVCGLPKEKAKKFILDNEGYDRSFYTGFLGEINSSSKTELFVNLRCAELTNNVVNIYVGGGITSQSNSEKEWQETVAKTQTIRKVL